MWGFFWEFLQGFLSEFLLGFAQGRSQLIGQDEGFETNPPVWASTLSKLIPTILLETY